MVDEQYMRRALELAQRGVGRASPNPAVGAVVVRDGQVVGEGYHEKAGLAHAEVVALEMAGERARGATLYVTLEPCCHYGRTPPCTRSIIASGVTRVVAATEDPNPVVAGRGFAELRAAGIEVVVGVLEAEARQLNEAFRKFIVTGRPFVALKWAMSLDGKIATRTGESRWISAEEARMFAHRLRDKYEAVLVGLGTVMRDDPLLTTRLPEGRGRDPMRVVLDSTARMPVEARLLTSGSPAPTIVAVTAAAPADRCERLRGAGAEIICVEADASGRADISCVLGELGARGVTSVLIEGGATVNSSAIKAGIADKVYAFVCPLIVGGTTAPGPVGGEGVAGLPGAPRLRRVRVKQIGEDFLITGYLRDGDTDVHGDN